MPRWVTRPARRGEPAIIRRGDCNHDYTAHLVDQVGGLLLPPPAFDPTLKVVGQILRAGSSSICSAARQWPNCPGAQDESAIAARPVGCRSVSIGLAIVNAPAGV